MKKMSVLLVIVLILNLCCITASAEQEKGTIPGKNINSLALPDLGFDIPKVSIENDKKIQQIADKIISLSASKRTIDRLDVSAHEKNQLKSEISQKYNVAKNELEALGAVQLNEKQAMQYVYGLSKEQVAEFSEEGNGQKSSSVPGINYPPVTGIIFYIYEYGISYTDGSHYDLAKCIALPDDNVANNKMMKNYDWVNMCESDEIRNLVNAVIGITAEQISGNLLTELVGGSMSFAISGLWELSGDVFPASTSTNSASLDLKVTSSSRVVHFWKKINGTYYFRLSTSAAVITESWVLVENSGAQKYKYHEFWAYSKYHFNEGDSRAIQVTAPESHSIYIPYKIRDSVLGIEYWNLKLEVFSYHAALPINFSS